MNTENALTKEVFESHAALIETLRAISFISYSDNESPYIHYFIGSNDATVVIIYAIYRYFVSRGDADFPKGDVDFPIEDKMDQKFIQFEERYVQ